VNDLYCTNNSISSAHGSWFMGHALLTTHHSYDSNPHVAKHKQNLFYILFVDFLQFT
jgi:hypothetical protein